MGKRGPAPTPTGLTRGRKPKRRDEPQPTRGVPAAPDFLDEEARAEWDRCVSLLDGAGVMTLADRGILAATCQAWSDIVRHAKTLKTDGYTFTTEKGYMVKNPAATMLQESHARWIKGAIQLGLTPASRTSLGSKPTPKDTEDFATSKPKLQLRTG